MKTSKLVTALAAAVVLAGVILPARAEDKKVDPTGTYIWVVPGRNGGEDRTNTLVLKFDSDQITGSLSTPGRNGRTVKTDIQDATLKDTEITFCVVRSFNDNTFTNKFSGKLDDGTIKGKVEFTRNGDTRSRDWEAKLQK